MELRGIYPALLSPFKNDLSLNLNALKKLVQKLVKENVHGFYAGGSSAELFALSINERKNAVETILQEANGKPVIVHVGAMNPQDAKELAQHAGKNNCAAISAIPPFYCKYTWEETAQYYRSLIDAAGLKMFLYNIPAFTGISLSTENYKELLKTKKIAGVKHTCINLFELERLKAANPKGIILAGYDDTFAAAQVMGAEGCIGTGVNALAPAFLKIDKYLKQGNIPAARNVQSEMNSLIEVCNQIGFFQANKLLVSMQGIPMGNCRPPFKPLKQIQKKRLEKAYETYEKNMQTL